MSPTAGHVHVDETFAGERSTLFERMATVATDPMYALDGDRRFVAVNEKLIAFTGHSPESLLGQHIRTILGNDSGLRSLDLMAAKVSEDNATLAGEFELETAEGSTRLCELEVTSMDPDQDSEAIVGTARDLTGDRRRKERLVVLDRVLRHNLRTKMGTVLGYLDMFLVSTEDPETVEMAETAREEANELLAIGNKARRFHRLLDLEPTRTTIDDLEPILESVVQSHREDHPDMSFALAPVEHDPVSVDAELLKAAIDEVIGNAVEHGTTGEANTDHRAEVIRERSTVWSEPQSGRDDGGSGPQASDSSSPSRGSDLPHANGDPLSVRVWVDQRKSRVNVHVADTGPGIDPEERRAILSGEEEPLYHASGLGFWLVKWALRLTGGELHIRANEPRGTVVTLSLPHSTG